MRYFSFVLSVFFLMSSLAWATPANPREGAEYITLTTPQPVVATGKKIEVIEFFMYHCPACNMLDSALSEWVKSQGDKVAFKQIHLPRKGSDDVETHLFLTLDALQMENALHSKVLRTWHVEHIQLLKDDDNVNWAMKNGIDKEKFVSVYYSFSVLNKLKDLPRIAANYQVDSTPTIIVDGRYLTSMARVSENNPNLTRATIAAATVQVVNALVVKAQADKP